MYNWSVDEEAMKTADPNGYEIWRLEQLINYGEEGEKIPEKELRKYWDILKNKIDPARRRYFELILSL